MMAPQTRVNYKLSVLLSICCLFILIILIAQRQYIIYSREQLFLALDNLTATPVDSTRLPEISLSQKSLESYQQMVSRPLFVEGRRPVEIVELDIPSIFSEKMDLTLTGVVDKPDGMLALLLDKQKQRFQLQLHDAYEGWQVEAIHADKIVFTRSNERSELPLRKPLKKQDKNLRLPKTAKPKRTRPGNITSRKQDK
jgi:hypothetical protein